MGIVRGRGLGRHADETNDRRGHSARSVVSIRSTGNGLRVVVFHFHFCRSFGVFVQRGRRVFVWHGQPFELQPGHGVRDDFFVALHGGAGSGHESVANVSKQIQRSKNGQRWDERDDERTVEVEKTIVPFGGAKFVWTDGVVLGEMLLLWCL